ncbi:hypothetical protein RHSIM_Rhsim12G0001100 [Rhododendron simsii]|uniref:Hexosyltransferase n=1 Tax=Rhododendron simsii TaxID=118357 RepID=A0A834G6V7_RHOSS|nr:hypothetical protein RHSIM_Rhsim12G0001100 [Rhododendron simsii]
MKEFTKERKQGKLVTGYQNLKLSVWRWQLLDNKPNKMRVVKPVAGKVILMLCIGSFLAGSLFTTRTSSIYSSENKDLENLNTVARDCDHKRKLFEGTGDIMGEVTKTHQAIQSLDKTISTLEMELAAARTKKSGSSNLLSLPKSSNHTLQKAFVVIGINTAFSSKKRRDSLRETWMPRGSVLILLLSPPLARSRDKLKRLEKEKGIIMRFVIGHSATPGGVLDRAVDEEAAENKDFLRLKHVEGYHQLSTKTRIYFSTVVSIWDAEFYVKVDDDVHLNLGMLVSTLARYRSKPRIYIGCMKSGPVLSQKYANEDVSLGSWFIGMEVEHVDARSMCCGTPPDCELKTQAGNVCVASFDWTCSGICKSVERMKNIHNTCAEGDGAVWNVDL